LKDGYEKRFVFLDAEAITGEIKDPDLLKNRVKQVEGRLIMEEDYSVLLPKGGGGVDVKRRVQTATHRT